MFKPLGVLPALYVGYAVIRGEVFAKSGARGRTVLLAETPHHFWAVVAVYGGLSVALVTVF